MQYSFPSEQKQSLFWVAAISLVAFLFFVKKPAKLPLQTPEPVTVLAEDPSWVDMQRTIDEMTGHYDGNVGVFIKDLKTGKTYEKNADEQFVTASLIKMPIMAATFHAIEENKLSLDSTIALRPWHLRGGSGHLQYARVGRRFRVSDLLYRMITESDNTATAIFLDRLGYEYFNREFLDFGLVTTKVNPTGMSLDDHVNPTLDNYTTAREMGMLLEKTYTHELASYGHCDLMLEWMKHAEGRARLARFLPKTWRLARKGGLLRKNCHDVGIVFTPKTDYVICVLTGKNRDYKHAIGLIANVGQTAYSHFNRS